MNESPKQHFGHIVVNKGKRFITLTHSDYPDNELVMTQDEAWNALDALEWALGVQQ